MAIPQRHLPALGRTVGAIGLGCMGMTWAYESDADERAGIEVIDRALAEGCTFLDTSDAYSAGENERLVGRAVPAGRDAVIATKVGLVPDRVLDSGRVLLRPLGTSEHVREAVDASLARLGRDVIDLYYLHRVDPEVPLDETWGALAELVNVGKVRALGLSEVSVAQADRAHAIHPVAAVQSELSLWTRDALGQGRTAQGEESGDLVAWTREHGAVFVPFSPLGRGFLTGALDPARLPEHDFRRSLPRFTEEAAHANQRIVDVVRGVADKHDTTPAAVALAWVLAQGEHVIPIPGTTKVANLLANLDASQLELGPDDLGELDAAPAAEGGRY